MASESYLVSISAREQVAQIRGKPIYVITDVALIPLSSRADAQSAISHARHALKHGKTDSWDDPDADTDDSDDETRASNTATDDEHDSVPSTPINEHPEPSKLAPLQRASTVVTDVIQNKGSYGRFANKWFSQAGWKTEGRRKQGMSSEENLSMTKEQKEAAENALPGDKKHGALHPAAEHVVDDSKTDKPGASSFDAIMTNLTPRILSTTKLFFSSRSFFFSYDYDISRSLSRQEPNTSTVPLHKRFEPLVTSFSGLDLSELR